MTPSLLALAVLQAGASSPVAVRLKPGDVVTVYVASDPTPLPTSPGTPNTPTASFGGDYTVLADGSIYGAGFGGLKIGGLTFLQAQELLRARMKRIRRPEDVFLSLKKLRTDYAYVVGSNSPGPVELPASPVTVRQLLPPLTEKLDAERLRVEVVRNGKTVAQVNYADLLQRDAKAGNMIVEPGDLISIVPEAVMRVWVLGGVKNPGQYSLPPGSNASQAIASAGGLTGLGRESTVSVQHGAEVTRIDSDITQGGTMPTLKDGDLVTVATAEPVRVTIIGEVSKPGEYFVAQNATVLSAVAKASGALPSGSLSDVLVLRDGNLIKLDLTVDANDPQRLGAKIQAGDTIVISEKRLVAFAFGEVKNPGRYYIDPSKPYRLSDLLAASGGLTEKGSYRRVFVMHPEATGKPTVRQYNIDEYLKDGKEASNPILQPGDSALFSPPKGLTLSGVTQVLSSYVIFGSLIRR